MATPQSLFGKLRLCCALFVLAAGSIATHGQLASETLVMRTYKLPPATNLLVPAPMQLRKEQIELMFAEMGISPIGDPAVRANRESNRVFLYNEESRLLTVHATAADIETLEPTLRRITGTPTIRIVTAEEARMRIQNAQPPTRQTPPRLPKDTRPDADPTPRNKERLPFPPTFIPVGFPKDPPR